MQWTDRIRQVKIVLVVMAIVIAVASLIVSQYLTHDLQVEEQRKMETWAQAMQALNQADETTDLTLVLQVLNGNNTIPVIVMDKHGLVSDFRNVELKGKSYADSLQYAARLGKEWQARGRNVRIILDAQGVQDENAAGVTAASESSDYIDVCYDDSLILKRLSLYPFVQLGVVMLFVVVAIFALLTSKRAEQNKVWVGLSKETAHQLGTPISSLMAWVEVLRETYPDDDLIPEMNNDVKRLQLIADRFSKVGSVPELSPTSLNGVLDHVVDYMDRRTSKQVNISKELPRENIVLPLNASLFEWVIENLCKNAADAMGGGAGSITLKVEDTPARTYIYVTDTGKGIRKKDVGNVFRPGFTTKKRGWGLGLSLARRIIEEYHRGKIYVKWSEVGKGTTFCIELKHT